MAEFHTRIIGLEQAQDDIVALQNRVFQMTEEMATRVRKDELANVEDRVNNIECNANYAVNMCSHLEEKITPSSIVGDLNEELNLLAKYKALGSPERIEKLIFGLKKDFTDVSKERDEAIEAAAELSKYINMLEKLTLPIEYVKAEILDMINNYDERTKGVAMSEAGNSRFFYILALSGLMNIFTEREKELNG